MSKKVQRFGVSLPEQLLELFDADNTRRGYANRSEAIRDLIRDRLVDSEWESAQGEAAGAVVLVYDHHTPGVTERLTEVQHDHHDIIIANMHAHLDHDNCMEVILLRGPNAELRKLAERLSSLKHVKLGRFVPATLGKDFS